MPKAIATNFAIRRDTTGRIFLELTTLKQRKFEFEISQSSLPTIRGHLIEALNLPRPTDQSGFQDMAAPILVQKIHVTPNHPVAGAISLRFEASNGQAIDIPLANSDAEAMILTLRQALGIDSHGPGQSELSDMAVQILSFRCECDPDTQQIFLHFDAPNGTPTVLTLTVPRAQEVFESVGKALTVLKANPTTTRQ